MSDETIRRICAASAAAALVCLATAFLRVPIPLGYAHLGDAVVFLAARLLPRREAALASAFGSFLADFLSGFPIWAGPTFLIKWIMASLASLGPNTRPVAVLAAWGAAALWLAAAYTAAGAMIYGSWEAGLASLPGLLAEGAVNLLAAAGLALLLKDRIRK